MSANVSLMVYFYRRGGGAGWYKSGPGFFCVESTPLENINEIVLKTFVSLTV